MTLPGFSAENSMGRTIPYQLAGSACEAQGVHPQGIPQGAVFNRARCFPRFEWVWGVCNVIDGVPIFCQKLQFLGVACT